MTEEVRRSAETTRIAAEEARQAAELARETQEGLSALLRELLTELRRRLATGATLDTSAIRVLGRDHALSRRAHAAGLLALADITSSCSSSSRLRLF